MKHKQIKFILILFLIALTGFGCSISPPAQECSHPALPEAYDALSSNNAVNVTTVTVEYWDGISPAPEDDNLYYLFSPKNSQPTTGFIILPGGNCDPVAYAPLARSIAAEGYLTIIVPVPNCVAVFGLGRVDTIIDAFGDIEIWVVGGHSVGGTAAGMYARKSGAVDGIVIWASIPDPSNRLDDTQVKVLVVSGSEDGRVPQEQIMAYAKYLPADTVYVEIEGGNHTQFGWFDPSPDPYFTGDHAATITLQEQQEHILRATVDFFNMISGRVL